MARYDRYVARILEEFQVECKNNIDLQYAISSYAKKHNLILPDNLTYEFGIDYFDVRVDDTPVLIVSLPPISNYFVEETEHTRRLLKSSHETTDIKYAVAV